MSEENLSTLPRRDFLKTTAAFGGVALTSGMLLYSVSQAKPPEEAVTQQVRWGLLIDTTQCQEGCTDCVNACNQEHGLEVHGERPEAQSQWIHKVNLRHKQTEKTHSLPMMCQHCAIPPCRDVCPTGASFKRADGIVLVDKHLCIGCRYCMMACPYKARSFVHEELTEQKSYSPRGKGTVEACTLCVHRVDQGERPACVAACQKQAMTFGDMNDPNSDISKKLKQIQSTALRDDLKLQPAVRYHGV